MNDRLRDIVAKLWREELHPRDLVGRFRIKNVPDFSRGVRSDGRLSLLTQAELDLDIDSQMARLRQIQADASVGGDYVVSREAAQELMSLHTGIVKGIEDKLGWHRDGDGDGWILEGTPFRRPAPIGPIPGSLGGVKTPKKKRFITLTDGRRISLDEIRRMSAEATSDPDNPLPPMTQAEEDASIPARIRTDKPGAREPMHNLVNPFLFRWQQAENEMRREEAARAFKPEIPTSERDTRDPIKRYAQDKEVAFVVNAHMRGIGHNESICTMCKLGDDWRARGPIQKAQAVDGDGDGLVHDGTPKERPATPSESAAGRLARAVRGGVKPGKKPSKHKPGDKFDIVGRDAKGNYYHEEADDPKAAERIARQWAAKKYRNVKVVRTSGDKVRTDKPAPSGKQPKNPNKPDKPDEGDPPDRTPEEDAAHTGIEDDRGRAIYNSISWGEYDIADEDKVAATHWLTSLDAAMVGNKQRFDEFMGKFFEETDDHEDPDGLQEAIDKIVDDNLSDELYSSVMDSLDSWGFDDPNTHFNNWKASGDMYYDASMAEQAKGTESYKHLSEGGSISDAPTDDLMASIKAMPERFKLSKNSSAGMSENWWVDDQETGERWMMKGGQRPEDTTSDVPNDHFNEIMAYNVFQGSGVNVAETRWASKPGEGSWIIQRDAGQEFGSGPGTLHDATAFFDEAAQIKVLLGEAKLDQKFANQFVTDSAVKSIDPNDFMAILLSDYLMGGSDRHTGNYMFHETDDGFRYQLVDNGGSFSAYDTSDLDMDFVNWLHGAGNDLPKMNALVARKLIGGNQDEMRASIDKYVSGLKLDMKAIRARLKDTPMTPSQRKMVAANLKALQARHKDLTTNVDAIVQEILEL